MNEKQFVQVLPEDFDARWLRKLSREGRLYYDANEPKLMASDDALRLVMEYVRPIATHVTPAYVPYIKLIWQEIAANPVINDKLIFVKGKKAGQLNRYYMMSLIENLKNLKVYDDSLSMIYYHHQLEHTTHKDCIYKNSFNYPVEHPQRMAIRRFIKKLL